MKVRIKEFQIYDFANFENFIEFAHGITAREWDEVTNSIGNLETCEARLGEVFPRSTRISIVMWNKQNFCN